MNSKDNAHLISKINLSREIMKSRTFAILTIVFLLVVGCNAQETPSRTSDKPAPPEIDLHMAAITGNVDAVQQHIRAGSDLNVKEPTRLSTPLITATVFGKTDVALALIGAGADLDYQNNEGSTSLLTAALFCRREIVEALLDKGADKSLTNQSGRNALDTVSGSFEDFIPIYDGISAALAPLGFQLDYDYIEATRPAIAEMLQ